MEVLLRVKNLLKARFLHMEQRDQNHRLEERVRERVRELTRDQESKLDQEKPQAKVGAPGASG